MSTTEVNNIAPNSENVIELTDAGIIGLDTLCRLCANRTDHLIPIYEGEGAEHELEMKMNRYLPFRVEKSQSMPMHCCFQCATTVLQWHELIEVSLEANRRLRALQEDAIVHLTKQYPKPENELIEIVSDNVLKNNSPQKPAQTRAASLISFRQAQTNFTVDFLSQSDNSVTLTSRRLSTNRRTVPNSVERANLSTSVKPKRKVRDGTNRLNGKTKRGRARSPKKELEVPVANIKTEEAWIKQEIEDTSFKHENYELDDLMVGVGDGRSEKISFGDAGSDVGFPDSISDDERDFEEVVEKIEKAAKKSIAKKRKPVRVHECETCSVTFKSAAELKSHLRSHETIVKKEIELGDKIGDYREILPDVEKIDEDTFCLICMQDFATETELEEHRIEYHKDECEIVDGKAVKRKLCPYCAKMFVTKAEVKAHKQLEHPERQRKRSKADQEAVRKAKVVVEQRTYYRCGECGKNLHSPYTFLWHRRIHTGERPFVCDLCGKQFRVSQGLVRHLRETHAGIKKFSCDICGRSFATRRNVEEHRRIHTNERPYVCALCGKAFKQKASLFVHHRSHTDSFPHKCSYCGQGFRTRPPLLVHVTRHTGEKPYPCDVCGRRFRIKYELKRHRLIHSDVKPFKCVECGISFRQKRYLRNHNKINHNRPTP